MHEVEGFIADFEGETRKILQLLHRYLHEDLGLIPRIRYKIPFYDSRSWICYLNPLKTGGVELAFPRGNELSNAQGLLTANGRKQVMGVSFHKAKEVPMESLNALMQEAILLDETVPYARSIIRTKKR